MGVPVAAAAAEDDVAEGAPAVAVPTPPPTPPTPAVVVAAVVDRVDGVEVVEDFEEVEVESEEDDEVTEDDRDVDDKADVVALVVCGIMLLVDPSKEVALSSSAPKVSNKRSMNLQIVVEFDVAALGEAVARGDEVNVESGARVGGEDMTTCELDPGTWMLNDGLGVGCGAEFVFKLSTGKLKTGGILTKAGIVRTPIGRVMSVGAVGRPSSVASATVLPLPSSMIRSTSVDTRSVCRRRSSLRGGGVMRDAGDDVVVPEFNVSMSCINSSILIGIVSIAGHSCISAGWTNGCLAATFVSCPSSVAK